MASDQVPQASQKDFKNSNSFVAATINAVTFVTIAICIGILIPRFGGKFTESRIYQTSNSVEEKKVVKSKRSIKKSNIQLSTLDK